MEILIVRRWHMLLIHCACNNNDEEDKQRAGQLKRQKRMYEHNVLRLQ